MVSQTYDMTKEFLLVDTILVKTSYSHTEIFNLRHYQTVNRIRNTRHVWKYRLTSLAMHIANTQVNTQPKQRKIAAKGNR